MPNPSNPREREHDIEQLYCVWQALCVLLSNHNCLQTSKIRSNFDETGTRLSVTSNLVSLDAIHSQPRVFSWPNKLQRSTFTQAKSQLMVWRGLLYFHKKHVKDINSVAAEHFLLCDMTMSQGYHVINQAWLQQQRIFLCVCLAASRYNCYVDLSVGPSCLTSSSWLYTTGTIASSSSRGSSCGDKDGHARLPLDFPVVMMFLWH